jgi:hypothetical protein
MIRGVRALIAYPLAILAGLLPKRYWEDIDLPVLNCAFASALLTFWAGTTLGITGFFSYMAYVLAEREWTAPPLMLVVFISYVVATPRGLFAVYLTATGLLRAAAWHTGEPFGDPILTGIDWLWRRLRTDAHARSTRNARLALEKADEPDRLYDGSWADLEGVTYVVVASRRKPGWTTGTWVITNDGWFTLGEPFDRPMPNGLRTVYPLTLQTNSLEVLRKGVSYELPPLRPPKAWRGTDSPGPQKAQNDTKAHGQD